MNEKNQLRAIRAHLVGEGFTNIQTDVFAFGIPYPLDFLAERDDRKYIVEILNKTREDSSDEHELARCDAIGLAIADKEEIDWDLRFLELHQKQCSCGKRYTE